MLILVLGFFELFRRFGILNLSPEVQGALSYGAIFTIGLTAAVSSCMAMVGGLLLSVSAKWAVAHQHKSRWRRFQPLLAFNAGRLFGYFMLGGVIGLIGTQLTFSIQTKGVLTIIIATSMLLLSLSILKILPKNVCRLPLPKPFQARLKALSESQNPVMPIILGALTFFVPCGFTQSMQVYALGSGSFLNGALIMFVFALGTLPSLLGISIISSVFEGRANRLFLTFAGVTSLIIGLGLLNSGLLLTGVNAQGLLQQAIFPQSRVTTSADTHDPYVTIDSQNRQVIGMRVSDHGFAPPSVTLKPGYDTWLYAYADTKPYGCASSIIVPAYNTQTIINAGGNWLHLGKVRAGENFQVLCSLAILRMDVFVTDD